MENLSPVMPFPCRQPREPANKNRKDNGWYSGSGNPPWKLFSQQFVESANAIDSLNDRHCTTAPGMEHGPIDTESRLKSPSRHDT